METNTIFTTIEPKTSYKRKEEGVPKVLSIIPEKCTACRACELACSVRHLEEFNPARSRIKVNIFMEEAIYLPTTCTQCDQAWCARICPTFAIVRDPETMAFTVKDEKCVGCRMCVLACPFGAIVVYPDLGKAEKCDHCLSTGGDPECVKFCVPMALEYRDEDVAVKAKQRATAMKLKESYKEVTV